MPMRATSLARVSGEAKLTEGLQWSVAVRSVAVRIRRRRATRRCACRGWGARKGVEVVAVSSDEGRQ
jgi:hypothetical protein